MIIKKINHFTNMLLDSEYRTKQLGYKHKYSELARLKEFPRYTPCQTDLLGKKIYLADSASFLYMYKEIFEEEIYKFKPKSEQPLIIDCGANIGLSVIYFKQNYPNSKIIAFEPDEKIHDILTKNINSLNLSDIEVIKKAVWNCETTLEFMSEGADAGRMVEIDSNIKKYEVKTIRLRDYLQQHIDLLKIDIEGAETEVIIDCADLLHNVDYLFIEYHSFVNQSQTLNKIIDVLTNNNFRIKIQSVIPLKKPFISDYTQLGMDVQLNIFAYRLYL